MSVGNHGKPELNNDFFFTTRQHMAIGSLNEATFFMVRERNGF